RKALHPAIRPAIDGHGTTLLLLPNGASERLDVQRVGVFRQRPTKLGASQYVHHLPVVQVRRTVGTDGCIHIRRVKICEVIFAELLDYSLPVPISESGPALR